MSEIRSIEFRVYLEGVLLPENIVSAAEVHVRPGQPKSFQVSLPALPLSLVRRIRPRTHVAVFFRDGLEEGADPWKLWAEGEFVGYGFQKSATGSIRTILAMEGIENYWRYTYAMHFQEAKSIGTSSFHDAEIVLGTAGRVLTLQMPEGGNVINVQTQVLAAIDEAADTPFPELFVKLFRSIRDLNAFFQSATDRLRLEDRFSFVPDDEVAQLIPAQSLSALMGRAFTSHPADATLLSIMQALMGNVHYGYQTVTFPPFVDGRPAEFLVKPDVPFVAPPRCNVIFPGRTTSFSFQRAYLSEPTRARMSLSVTRSPDGDRNFRLHFYAPEQMEGVVQEVLSTDGAPRNIEALQMSGDDVDDESREDIKGVIPLVSNIPLFELNVLSAETTEAERKAYFSGLTNYNLKLAQHGPRGLSVSGPFNPYLVCGLPGALLTEQGVIFGNIQSVSHSVHSSGAPQTSVVMTHCRDEDLSELQEPVWKNERYTDRDRLDETYATLLGEGHASILAPVSGLGELLATRFRDQALAAERLLDTYRSTEVKESFEEAYTRRSIVRLKELFGFLKATLVGQNYQGGPFRGEWSAVAREVASHLSQVVQDAR